VSRWGPAVRSQPASKRTVERAIAVAIGTALLATGAIRAVVAQEPPRFEVASVRPHRPVDDVMFALQFHEGGRLTATGTLRLLIRTAHRLQEFQVVGPGGWIDEEQFEVDGRAGRDATPDELRVMLRALLRERFRLVLRSERRDAPVYALRAVKPGTLGRMRPAAEVCPAACSIRFAPGALNARGVTMAMLASELSWWVDRTVTDQTALEGRFDLDLEWAADVLPQAPAVVSTADPPVAARVDSNAPSIFTAVREQLGLSLEAERGDVDVFVIDRAERPTQN
jgi:uncharacterized protein (TIGR03435 family)